MPPELIGYANRWSVKPGEPIRFMVSTDLPDYEAAIVRLIHGDENPAGPGFKEQLVQTDVNRSYTGRKQVAVSGSYVIVADNPALANLGSLTLQAWILPTLPAIGRNQGLITKWSSKDNSGYGLYIGEKGDLALWLGDGKNVEQVATGKPMRANEWYFVAATFDAASKSMMLYQQPLSDWPSEQTAAIHESQVQVLGIGRNSAPLLIAAAYSESLGNSRVVGRDTFNGKIDRPRLFERALSADEISALKTGESPAEMKGLVAAWDFAAEPSSAKAVDTSKNKLHGTVVNMPTRGVPGHNWTRSTVDFKQAPGEFGAIHFHEDDLEDAGWETDFTLTVPADLKSGVYAARLRSGDQEDYIPFFIRPRKATASILVLFPTNTYLAYANFRQKDWQVYAAMITDRVAVRDPLDEYLEVHPELGLSIYDFHSDDTGNSYSSLLRPIVTIRPKFRSFLAGGPRHFGADLYLIDWLEHKSFSYDVATDEDLHFEGTSLLSQYKVVLTGSHPEYWSAQMLDALEQYRDSGGRIMYLGGNGFYWVTSFDPQRPHIVEVRRGYGGTRTWSSTPGEYYHSTTGEPGGLWRHRGQAPNKFVGIGFSAQGWNGKAPGYKRKAGSFDPRAAFIFEGVGADETIGDFGLAMGGAAGDEVDRVDYKLGSPPHTLILASSEGHNPSVMPVIEDFDQLSSDFMAGNFPTVRADMAYFETPNGGAVFSTGAITWIGSLSHNNYDNNVSRITENVLRKFST